MYLVYDKETKKVKYECSFIPENESYLELPSIYPEGVVEYAVSENDELVPIYRQLPTEEQLAMSKLYNEKKQLKIKLQETDYRAIKYAEGQLSEEEYADTKAQRIA